jgi:hypothetical protein
MIATTTAKKSSGKQLYFISIKNKFQKKRGAAPCEVRQLPGLDYTEPRFEISVRAADDRCQVKLFLDVGTVPGGSDVMKEKELGGQSTIIKEVSFFSLFLSHF